MMYSHYDDMPGDIRARAAQVRLAVFDVDGVLTDGRLIYAEDGRETKAFHVHDGLGLKRLLANGIEVAIITARSSRIVANRMAELGIAHVYQGEGDKRTCLHELLRALELKATDVAYTGDDVPDLRAMSEVGFAIAVANAHPWVLERAHWRTQKIGGSGAVREVCDLLLAAHGKSELELERALS